MKAFCSKLIQLIPGVSALAVLVLGFAGYGCQGGEKDLFTDGFTCAESLQFGSQRDCSASAAISFVSPNR